MKLLAQLGHGTGEKVTRGLRLGCIDGFIFSPRDKQPDSVAGFFNGIADEFPNSMRLFDPQMYVLTVSSKSGFDAKKLHDYPFYPDVAPTKRELQSEDTIKRLIGDCIRFQNELRATHVVLPNVLVPGDMDSVWGSIARDFIRIGSTSKRKTRTKVLATIALTSSALASREELEDFLDEITGADSRPDGFYILVSMPDGYWRNAIESSIYFANWLYLTYALSVNGFEVFVGYSDYSSAFHGVLGATAGATGWFENLRRFSINKFVPQKKGGQLPLARYSSPVMLSRLLLNELEMAMASRLLREKVLSAPDFLKEFEAEASGQEIQAIQHWAAVKNSIQMAAEAKGANEIEKGLTFARDAKQAITLLRKESIGGLDPKTDDGFSELAYESLLQLKDMIN